ncbi:hypothetical protein [Microbulbifer hainanensis]|uniref:hypothetical protein n=1 Tax=Microbulbifer hainanensis TaxID=2735675 RepID=UPI001865A882|nr:hypothetical protein [Microbulbifer hainanensis]
MSDGLLRQRRNLILISSLLIFLRFSKVEISKLSFLGVEFGSFENPSAIYVALWIVWGYFLIRYYQYFMQEGFNESVVKFSEALSEKSRRVIKAAVDKDYPDNTGGEVDFFLLKNWMWIYHGQESNGIPSGHDGHRLENFHFRFQRRKLVRPVIMSIYTTVVNRSAFTDYYMPLLIAVFALAYGFSGWDGSLVGALKSLIT